jgi:very-short-patch-repair endonuclease
MQHELVLIMRSTGKLIAVSDCEHPLPGTFFKVDACVTNRNGKIIVIEFDGPTHFVAPFGGLNGATLWRNELLRMAGYTVLSVTSEEWNDKQNRRELLMRKLRDFL